ncbi:MAG: PQQ-binding-like beta-propeller repeat protein [Verrucomicrobiota bacterium]
MNPRLLLLLILPGMVFSSSLRSEDWPMWRHDSGRTAVASESLGDGKMELLWSRRLPLNKPAYHDGRLQFDRGYEPVAVGGRLFIGSNLDDSVSAFDANTGKQLWKFFTEGPVRFAPVVWQGKVIFGSDDGHLYSVSVEKGELLWKFRAVPSARKLTGNQRLISVWPVRGGPVVHQGRIYFAAGVLPFEGVFVYCLDVVSGEVIWLNDRTGHIYGQQPHGSEALGGLAPQGYLLVNEDELVVPSSNAYPATFDLKTGELKAFKLPNAGRKPGGWFASTAAAKKKQKQKRRGLLFDDEVNQARHEYGPYKEGDAGVRDKIVTGTVEWDFKKAFPELNKEVYTMLAAGGKLFVVTLDGGIYAYGHLDEQTKKDHKMNKYRAASNSLPTKSAAEAMILLASVKQKRGLMVMMGAADNLVLQTLLKFSNFRILVIEPDAGRVKKLRDFLDHRGLYGSWVTVWHRPGLEMNLPPYSVDVMVVNQSAALKPETVSKWYQSLRPFGGTLLGAGKLLEVAKSVKLSHAQFDDDGQGLGQVIRQGALPGASNYTGDWSQSPDARVKAPLGTLWFDDSLGLYKRSPQPKIIDGVMISTNKDWHDDSSRGAGEARLLDAQFSSVYTGRVFEADEVLPLRQSFGMVDLKSMQPWTYRPPTHEKNFRAGPLQAGTRINLLTGEKEPRVFTKRYGCDGGFDYGRMFTMRSATAAFYDKTIESGPINISGPRSGCTNSVIPAAGVLNVPYFYQGCTCSYPLPIGLSLVSQPQTYEQWMAWGAVERAEFAGKIVRLGVNLGALGDRVTDDGTLWLDHPSVGGPSPDVEVVVKPEQAKPFYHHSLWVEGGRGWPWVASSGMQGVEQVEIGGVKAGEYSVRLVFIEPENLTVGQRVFDVSLQGKSVLKSFDVMKEGQGRMRAVTKIIGGVVVAEDGEILVALKRIKGLPVLSGIELIRTGLPSDQPLALQEVMTRPLQGIK